MTTMADGAREYDQLMDCLADRHRRYAVDCLREHRTMTLADLADEVSVREYGQQLNEIPAETVKEIYLRLYHTHIPKLESAALVEYRQSADAVEAGEAIERAVPFLDLIEEGR